MSGPTRKLLHRSRDRARAAAARKARSAVMNPIRVVKRTRLPPRRRTFSSAEDLQLVMDDDGLEIQLIEAPAGEQAEQPAQEPVPD